MAISTREERENSTKRTSILFHSVWCSVRINKELKAIQKLVAALNKHAYKTHVSGELTAIGIELGKADVHQPFRRSTIIWVMSTRALAMTTKPGVLLRIRS